MGVASSCSSAPALNYFLQTDPSPILFFAQMCQFPSSRDGVFIQPRSQGLSKEGKKRDPGNEVGLYCLCSRNIVTALDLTSMQLTKSWYKICSIEAKGQGIPRDDILLHVDNADSTLLHLAVESGVAKVININC